MIDIKRQESKGREESIEKMISRYRRQRKTMQVSKECGRRKHYVKPSEARRKEIAKATYKRKKGY